MLMPRSSRTSHRSFVVKIQCGCAGAPRREFHYTMRGSIIVVPNSGIRGDVGPGHRRSEGEFLRWVKTPVRAGGLTL